MRHQQRSSAFLADFIHDIIETDYKADVLRELSKQCQNQANLIKAKGNEVCNFEHKKLEAIKEELDDLSRHKDSSGNFVEQYKLVYDTVYRKVKTKFFSWLRIFSYYAIFFIITFILFVVVASFLQTDKIQIDYWIIITISLGVLFITPLLFAFLFNLLYVLFHPESNEKHEIEEKKNITNYLLKEQSAMMRLEFEQENYKIALEIKKKHDENATAFEEKAKFFEQQAVKLDKAKTKMLNLNIIPQDYRDLVCLFELHKIFRNNLADTMREAIAIYEERVFRGIVVQGIYQMNNKINLISEYITDMSDDLHKIRTNSNFMTNEIQHIREIQERNHDNQNQLLDEMRAVRYANQATLHSQERCERYLNYQYWKN